MCVCVKLVLCLCAIVSVCAFFATLKNKFSRNLFSVEKVHSFWKATDVRVIDFHAFQNVDIMILNHMYILAVVYVTVNYIVLYE